MLSYMLQKKVQTTRCLLLIVIAWIGFFSSCPPSFALTVDKETLLDNGNVNSVYENPSQPTTFTITAPYSISYIETYHWNSQQGKTPGTISLEHSDGTTYGPWTAQGRDGQGGVPNAYWYVEPFETIKAGTYTIQVSDTASWSHNAASGNQGFAVVKGFWAGSIGSSSFSQLGANIDNFRFFESDKTSPSQDQITFDTVFSKDTARYIYYQINLSYPLRSQDETYTLTMRYYKPDGSILWESDHDIILQQGWDSSWHSYGVGWDTAGNWEEGTYTVKLFDESTEITSGTFNIVSTNSLTPDPDSLTLDVKANGSDGPVTISEGDSLSITLSLAPGDYAGRNVDWWFAMLDSSGNWHSLVSRPSISEDWYEGLKDWTKGLERSFSAPMEKLQSFEIPAPFLKPGQNFLAFALDDNDDGKLDVTWLDFVEIDVNTESPSNAADDEQDQDKIVLNGPGGTTILKPSETDENEVSIFMSEYTSSVLLGYDEQAASTAVKIELGNENYTAANASYKMTFPITMQMVDPENLRVMVRMDDGTVLPVIGMYDGIEKTYSINLYGLAHDWVMGVVSGRPMREISAEKIAYAASKMSTRTTVADWPSLDYKIYDASKTVPSPIGSPSIKSDIQLIAQDVLITLQNAGFKAPLLQQAKGGGYEMYLIDSDMEHNAGTGASYYLPPHANLLGRVYIFYNSYMPDYTNTSTWSLGNVIMHETFHAVQFAHEYRFDTVRATPANGNKAYSSAAAYQEGTANIMGATYQATDAIDDVTVDTDFGPHMLDRTIDDSTDSSPYTKQDFFAFLAKRYFAREGLGFLDDLFGFVGASASGKWGSSVDDYLLMYRQGLDLFLTSWVLTLPEVYTEYALQRLYLHEPDYLLRDEKTKTEENEDSLFAVKRLNHSLLTWDTSYKIWESQLKHDFEYDDLSFTGIKPLSSVAATMEIPGNLPENMKNGVVPISIALSGGNVTHQMREEGVRIVIIRENYGVPVEKDAIVTVNDISTPIEVSLEDSVSHLQFIVINSYVKNNPVNISFRVPKIKADLKFKFKGPACCHGFYEGIGFACLPGWGSEIDVTVTDLEGNLVANSLSFAVTPGKSYQISLDYKYTWVTASCVDDGCLSVTNCDDSEDSRTVENGTVTEKITIPADAATSLRYLVDGDTGTILLDE